MAKKPKSPDTSLDLASRDMDLPPWATVPDDTNVTPWLRIVAGCAAGTVEAPLTSPQDYAQIVCARARAIAFLMDNYDSP